MRKTNKVVALLLTLVFLLSAIIPVGAAPTATDITTSAVGLAAYGILDTPGDTASTLTRGQFAKIASLAGGKTAADYTTAQAKASIYKDIKTADWYNGWSQLAPFQGIDAAPNFAPKALIKRIEVLRILVRLMGIEDVADNAAFMAQARLLGLTDAADADANGAVTRGEAFVIAAKALDMDLGAKYFPAKAAILAATGVKVLSAKAINATQVKVMFNKEVETASATSPGNFKIGSLTTTTAALQADKKSVIVTVTAPITGTNLYVIQPIKSLAVATNFSPIFTTVETFSDTVAPTVAKIEYTTYDTAKVTFSEPIATFGAISATQDGSAKTVPTSSGIDYITFDLSGVTLTTDKAISVVIVGTQDKAGNLSSPNPLVLSLTKTKTDVVAPSVVSVKALSNVRVEITFSEKLSLTPATITANGKAVTLLSSTDQITYIGTMAISALGIGTIAVSDDYKDTSMNVGAAYTSGLLQFSNDIVAPKFVSSEVVTVPSGQALVLRYDEQVSVSDASITLAGIRVKDYISYTLPTTTPVAVTAYDTTNGAIATDVKAVMILLGDDFVSGSTYTVTIPTGTVMDTATPALTAVAQTVTFVKGVASTVVDSGKPTVSSAAIESNNEFMRVTFSEAMDPATALNVANYKIGGVSIFSAAIFDASASVVKLTVIPGTIMYTGNYNLSISGAKDAAGNLMDVNSAVALVKENVKPFLATAVLKTVTTVAITMSETTSTTLLAADFEVYVNGVKVTNGGITTGNAISATIEFSPAITVLATDVVQVKLVSALLDLADNKATTGVLVTATK